jgi:hypothetical protein
MYEFLDATSVAIYVTHTSAVYDLTVSSKEFDPHMK